MLQVGPRGRVALFTLILLTLLTPLLAACGGSSTAAGLDGSHWNLSAMKTHDGAAPPLPGSAITLEIRRVPTCHRYNIHERARFTFTR